MATSEQSRTDFLGGLGADYAGAGEHRPLAGYSALSATFLAGLSAALLAARRDGLPERMPTRDIVLGGVATYKLSRLIAKDKVTAYVRAPFTRFQEPAGHGEVEEAPRGHGLRYAIGELLVCPYCLGQWVAGAFVAGYLHAPRLTRLLASMSAIHAIADVLQLGYKAAQDRQ